jgi:hypothetical protein
LIASFRVRGSEAPPAPRLVKPVGNGHAVATNGALTNFEPF